MSGKGIDSSTGGLTTRALTSILNKQFGPKFSESWLRLIVKTSSKTGACLRTKPTELVRCSAWKFFSQSLY